MSDEYSEYESQRYIEQRLAQLSGKSNTRFDEVDQRQALQESALRKESVASSLGQTSVREQETVVTNTNEQVAQTVQTEQSSATSDVTSEQVGQTVQIEQPSVTSEQADNGLVETTNVSQYSESETNETNVVDGSTQENVQINQTEQSIVSNEQTTSGSIETTVVNDEQVSVLQSSNETNNVAPDAFLMEYQQYRSQRNLKATDCKILRVERSVADQLQQYCETHSSSSWQHEPLNMNVVLTLLVKKFLKESEEQ